MAYKYSLSLPAQKDLSEIVDYIAADKPESARKVYNNFKKKFEFIEGFPESGRVRIEYNSSWFSITEGKYVIFYEIVDTNVIIARILHSSRDVANISLQ